MTLAQCARHLMDWHDGRFARHESLPRMLFDFLMRQRVCATGQAFIRTNQLETQAGADEVRQAREALLRGEVPDLVRRLCLCGSSVRGSDAFWSAMRSQLTAMASFLPQRPADFFALTAVRALAGLQLPVARQHAPSRRTWAPRPRRSAGRTV
jgi:hypothetical protein